MANLGSVVQLLRKEHDRLTRELNGISAALQAFGSAYGKRTGGRKISAAGRARIVAAQKARWAKVRSNGSQPKNVTAMLKKRIMSTAARKRIAQAQRARWAKVRAARKGTKR